MSDNGYCAFYVLFCCHGFTSLSFEQIENSTSPDKEELQQIINLLEMVLNNQVPAQKGLLSKFSAVLERNSWITGSIASALLSWLTTQIV